MALWNASNLRRQANVDVKEDAERVEEVSRDGILRRQGGGYSVFCLLQAEATGRALKVTKHISIYMLDQ